MESEVAVLGYGVSRERFSKTTIPMQAGKTRENNLTQEQKIKVGTTWLKTKRKFINMS